MKDKHTPQQVAATIKSIIKKRFKDLGSYAHEKHITPTQIYTILNGKGYMSFFSAIRFRTDFDLNLDYCTKGELPVLSPDHDYMELLGAATEFYYAVQEEDNIRDEYERKREKLSAEENALYLKTIAQARIKKAKAGCELVDLMNIGWDEENPDEDIVKPIIPQNTMKLHEAIEMVLRDAGTPLTFTQIAKLINKQNLYNRKDGKPVPASQISARVKNYPQLFEVQRNMSPIKIYLPDGKDN